MGTKVKLSYDELSLAWRAIWNSLSKVEDATARLNKTARIFTEMLPTVGWTLDEWNAETKRLKAAPAGRT